jgi:hypothetical protein
MFCPKCGAQNADDAKFCRACGTDISLVPQAVTGQLAQRLSEGEGDRDYSRRGGRRRRGGKPTVERAVRSFMMGLAFIFVALSVWTWSPAGRLWWFWLLIPAASMIADGVGTYIRLQEEKKRLAPPTYVPAQAAMPPQAPRAGALPPRNTGEIVPPPSVTENTTRLLDNVPADSKRGDA